MCGRWVVEFSDEIAIEQFRIDRVIDHLTPNYNVLPKSKMPIIVEAKDGAREMREFTWGLRRIWAKQKPPTEDDPKPKKPFEPINARDDGVATNGMFRDLLKSKRCLIPASGYFEWQGEKPPKRPFYIRLTDRKAFAFAGLYDIWKGDDDEWVATYTIITTTPAESIAKIHDRMPVILHPEDEELWLSRDVKEPAAVLPLLKSYESDALEAYEVGSRVGSRKENDPGLIEPVSEA